MNELRHSIGKNKAYIQNSLRRYLYFNYDITPMISEIIKQSLQNIENIKVNYHEPANSPTKERARGLSSMFKKLVNIPEKKKESLKFSEIKSMDLNLNGRLDQMMSSSPFDKLMLLKVEGSEVDKLLMKNKKMFSGPDFRQVFRENQNDIFRKETQSKAGEFIVEFNQVIVNIGDSSEGLREMCIFLCKEVSQSYVYLQTLLKEYHNLVTIKEYLYSEMIVQNMQTALLKKDLRVAKGLNDNYHSNEELASLMNTQKKDIQSLQVEN